MNLAPICLTVASMTAHFGQFLFPIGFVSLFLATIGLRSPIHTAAIAHRHATCAYASTCRRRKITAVHPPGTHTSPPRRRFYHAARTGTRSVRGVFFLAVGDRAAFPPTRRRQPHLHRGNGGGGPPDISLEFFFFLTQHGSGSSLWCVVPYRQFHRRLLLHRRASCQTRMVDYPSCLRSPFGAPRCVPPSNMCFPIWVFGRLPLCSPVLASPSSPPRTPPHSSPLLPPFFSRLPSPGSRLRACHVFLCCCSRRRAVLRATSDVNRVTPTGTLALATPSSVTESSSAVPQFGVGGDRPSPSAPPLPH